MNWILENEFLYVLITLAGLGILCSNLKEIHRVSFNYMMTKGYMILCIEFTQLSNPNNKPLNNLVITKLNKENFCRPGCTSMVATEPMERPPLTINQIGTLKTKWIQCKKPIKPLQWQEPNQGQMEGQDQSSPYRVHWSFNMHGFPINSHPWFMTKTLNIVLRPLKNPSWWLLVSTLCLPFLHVIS